MRERMTLERDGTVVVSELERATGTPARLRGLLGRRGLDPGTGMLFERAHQVHTFGMRFTIDVIFCDADLTVLRVVRGMKPWRLSAWVRRARYVVEVTAGGARGLEKGDRLVLRG